MKRVRKLGANLHDENEVRYLLGKKNQAQSLVDYRLSLGVPEGSNGSDSSTSPEFTLQDSLRALRRAEGILSQAFESADAARRSFALKEWLNVQEARAKLEIQIHEAEKLGAESLPVDDVKREWFAALQSYRAELESIPAKWSVFLFQKEHWEVEEQLKKLASGLIAKHLSL